MLQLKETYNNYLNLHQEFSEEHRVTNKEIVELYVIPRIFIEENEKNIKNFVQMHTNTNAPHRAELSYNGMRDFLYKLEDFKLQTIELFFEHKAYIECCTEYITRVNEIKENGMGKDIPGSEQDYAELTPIVTELRMNLKNLYNKAVEMTTQLNKIESRWMSISSYA